MIKKFDFGQEQEDYLEVIKNSQSYTFLIKKVYMKDQIELSALGKLTEEDQLRYVLSFLDKTLQGDIVFSDLSITMAEAREILNYVFMKLSGLSEEEFKRNQDLEQQRLTARPIQSGSMAERAKASVRVEEVKAAEDAKPKE